MFCSYCGQKTDPNLPKCIHCGAGIDNTPRRECKKCGYQNSSKSFMCSGCGVNMDKWEKEEEEKSVKCPKCGSKEYYVGKKGFNIFKACMGMFFAGPFGLLCGAHKANRVKLTCLKCRHRW